MVRYAGLDVEVCLSGDSASGAMQVEARDYLSDFSVAYFMHTESWILQTNIQICEQE
jgi:hypothetical protein